MLDDHDRGGLLVGEDDRVLLVRKRATKAFMQPGGKIEPCEAPIAALLRELREELGLVIPSHAAIHLGRFTAPGGRRRGTNTARASIDLSVSFSARDWNNGSSILSGSRHRD
jgi:8-oxo-dGTP pyrophosphatase MutT (NUDIX family)